VGSIEIIAGYDPILYLCRETKVSPTTPSFIVRSIEIIAGTNSMGAVRIIRSETKFSVFFIKSKYIAFYKIINCCIKPLKRLNTVKDGVVSCDYFNRIHDKGWGRRGNLGFPTNNIKRYLVLNQ
jgi:hypothetical protein